MNKTCLFGNESVYRMPSLVNTGNALVAVCCRETNGDDFGYAELVCKRSEDGGKTWSEASLIAAPPAREIIEPSSSKSSFFVNPCMTVAQNGDIVLLVTFFPESMGLADKKFLEKKTAFTGFDSKLYPIIYDRDGNYYIVLDDGRVLSSVKTKTPFHIEGLGELYKDDEYVGNIYLNGAMGKSDNETKTTFGALLKAPKRSYVFMFKSSDDGKTWSKGKDITRDILLDSDSTFLGTASGNALKTEGGRLIFPLYTLKNTVCVYSDDNGETFSRNKRNPYAQNTDEWCAVQAADGGIYSFGSASGKTPQSISKDNGISWIKDKKAPFKAPKCQKSAVVINNNVYVSHPSKQSTGVISKGEFSADKKGNVKGIKWNKEGIKINNEHFACSSLAVLDESTIGILYESSSTTIVFQTTNI